MRGQAAHGGYAVTGVLSLDWLPNIEAVPDEWCLHAQAVMGSSDCSCQGSHQICWAHGFRRIRHKKTALAHSRLHARCTERKLGSVGRFHLLTWAELHGAAGKHSTADALADCIQSGHGISCQGRWADAWSTSANPPSQQETPTLRRMPFEPAHQSAQGWPKQAEQATLLLRSFMSSSSAKLLSHDRRCGQAM